MSMNEIEQKGMNENEEKKERGIEIADTGMSINRMVQKEVKRIEAKNPGRKVSEKGIIEIRKRIVDKEMQQRIRKMEMMNHGKKISEKEKDKIEQQIVDELVKEEISAIEETRGKKMNEFGKLLTEEEMRKQIGREKKELSDRVDFEMGIKAIILETERRTGKKLSKQERLKIEKRERAKREKQKRDEVNNKRVNKNMGKYMIAGLAITLGTYAFSQYYQTDHELQAVSESDKEQDMNEEGQGIGEENPILEKIANNFNVQYPDTPVEVKNLSIVRSMPERLIKQENEDGSITYIEDCSGEIELAENQETIENEEDHKGSNENIELYSIDGNYVVVDEGNKTIILSEGLINDQVVDIDTRTVETEEGVVYVADDKDFKIDFESEADRTEAYIDLRNKWEEIHKQKEAEREAEQKLKKEKDSDWVL